MAPKRQRVIKQHIVSALAENRAGIFRARIVDVSQTTITVEAQAIWTN